MLEVDLKWKLSLSGVEESRKNSSKHAEDFFIIKFLTMVSASKFSPP